VRGGRAAVYDCGTAEGWKGQVAVACRELEGRCLHQCLAVSLTFYLARPKGHFRSNGQLKPNAPVFLHDKKPDVDNLAKAVLDALTGIRAWLDDAQVCELNVRRYYELPGEYVQGCLIRISELTEATL
jgi:Holliday junction resolvase RusA-like endonuclease